MLEAETLRRRASTDAHAREQLAEMAYSRTVPAVMSIVRGNRLYEKEDVQQQVWIHVLEAIDNDKGHGDILYYVKWFTINRIRDWIGSTVRRHAFAVCEECGNSMPIKSVKERMCSRCGAGHEHIESKSFIDRSTDLNFVSNCRDDDHTRLYVSEFLDSIDNERDRAILLGYIADVDRAQLAVRHGVSAGRISQIMNRIQSYYAEYSNS